MNILKKYSGIALIALSFVGAPAWADIKPIIQLTGKLTVSADANGNNDPGGGFLRVDKPAGGTVRAAYLMAASHGVFGHRVINDGDVILAVKPVTWDRAVFNNAGADPTFFHNVFADVTSIVKPIIDAAGPGVTLMSVEEVGTTTIDGTILVVIFEDTNQSANRSVILLFGGQSTLGDTFVINLAAALAADPNLTAIMGLGVAHSFQGTTGTPMVSFITVNGSRLTSSEGGEDDGIGADGGLISVGGIGDSIANPPNPFAPSTGFRSDDELYDLRPFLKVGDKSITVDTVNPTNDDDILFAYLVTSFQAAILPPVTPPGARTVVGPIDSNLPTIVLTHGLQEKGEAIQKLWTGTGPKQAGTLIHDSLGTTQVNIVQYIWEEAYQPYGCLNLALPNGAAYEAARSNAYDAGIRLASELLGFLGVGYNKPVHFIGHSLGTVVNTFAAEAFLNEVPGVKEIQFTALDRPHHLGTKCNFPGDTPYDSNFFAANLPVSRPDLTLRIDNFYSFDGAAVGDIANGPVYNHPKLVEPDRVGDHLFFEEGKFGFNNDHSGVHQWYRWTIKPHDDILSGPTVCDGSNYAPGKNPFFFDESLNPCQRGWSWSLNQNKDGFPCKARGAQEFCLPDGKPLLFTPAALLQLTQSRLFGCNIDVINGVTRIDCKEASSPFFMAQVDIPNDADYLTFEYNFLNAGDGDYAAVLLDDVAVWVLGGSSAITGKFVRSGAIPVGRLRGSRTLTVALYSAGQPNFEFMTQNFSVFGVTVLNPPPALASLSSTSVIAGGHSFSLTVNGTGFLTGATLLWNGSPRVTNFVSDTQITATILDADIASAGVNQVTVTNPDPTTGPSAALTFTVNNSLAVLTSFSPASVAAASAAFTLAVTGQNFVPTSVVRWNGSDRPTTFVNTTQVNAAITAADIATGGAAQVTVFNPAPGGGTSSALSFSVADFAVGSSPSTATVTAGQSATYTVTTTPQFGSFGNAITLSCSGLPTLSSCSFSPSTLTPGASAINSTLTISTTAASAVPAVPASREYPPLRLVPWTVLAALALVAAGLSARAPKYRRLAASMPLALLLVLLAIHVAGCAGGNASTPPPPRPATPAGTYTITAAGTSGSLQHSTTFTLTVH